MNAVQSYTPQDIEKVQQIKKWLAEKDQSRAWLSKKTGMPNGTVSQVLNGKYASSPTKQLDAMQAVLQVESERLADGTVGYVEGKVHQLLFVVLDRTRKYASFGVVCGHVGVGKTRTLVEYATRKPQTLLVEGIPRMTPGVMLENLLGQLGKPVPNGLDRKFAEVVRTIKGTNYVIAVDEAENLSADALHYLRRIRDMAQVGVLLSGTEKLHTLIKPLHGQFDQIRSRVAMWPKTIESIARDDADEMARVACGDLPDEVLDALWAYCEGSARVLMESLVPAIKDYVGDKALTPALIDRLASSVLRLARKEDR